MCEAFHALTVEPAANEIMPEPDSNFRQEMTEQWTLSNDQPEGHGFQAPAKGHVATSLPAALQCWISYTQAKVLTIKKDLRLLRDDTMSVGQLQQNQHDVVQRQLRE